MEIKGKTLLVLKESKAGKSYLVASISNKRKDNTYSHKYILTNVCDKNGKLGNESVISYMKEKNFGCMQLDVKEGFISLIEKVENFKGKETTSLNVSFVFTKYDVLKTYANKFNKSVKDEDLPF